MPRGQWGSANHHPNLEVGPHVSGVQQQQQQQQHRKHKVINYSLVHSQVTELFFLLFWMDYVSSLIHSSRVPSHVNICPSNILNKGGT